MKRLILAIVAVVVVGGIGVVGVREYLTVYRSQSAYAVVPTTPAKKFARDSDGQKVTDAQGRQEYSYTYKFVWVTINGTKRTVTFEQTGAKVQPMTPGTYVRAEVSEKRVTKGPFIVAKRKIPVKVLRQLQ